ncbi:melanoma-associated antigen B5-like [Tenrec ecaudatus]|uniref:melanoma-associated antigen B5-like n=1 Tax=Tenrec ecaudatus TaxID=94439 RepID=UPI003F59EFD0
MPQKRKIKHQKDEKHQQVQGKAHDQGGAHGEATVREEPSSSSSSSPICEGNTHSSDAAKGPFTPQEPQRPSSGINTSKDRRTDQGVKGPHMHCLNYPNNEALGINPIALRAYLLEHFMLDKFKMKQRITKDDILKIISPKHKDRFSEILKHAAENLEVGFAVEVKQADCSIESYTLVSKLALPNNRLVHPGRGFPKTGPLMVLLGVIFLKGHHATEKMIWEFLNTMRIFPGRKLFIYGELITKDLVKLKYLEYQQVPNSDPPCYEFLWGPRAHAEAYKTKILEFMAKANDVAPCSLPSLYKQDARKEGTAQHSLMGMVSATGLANAFGKFRFSTHSQHL